MIGLEPVETSIIRRRAQEYVRAQGRPPIVAKPLGENEIQLHADTFTNVPNPLSRGDREKSTVEGGSRGRF